MADEWRSAMQERLQRMANDGFEDLTIICGDKQFKVHSMILCMHSRVFEKMCRGKLKEAQEKTIDLTDDGVGPLSAMIDWFYSSAWTYPGDNTTSPLEFDCSMCILADKYAVKRLKETAIRGFTEHIDSATDDALVCAATRAYDALDATKDIRPMLVDRLVECEAWEPGPHLEELTTGSTMLAWDIVAATKKSAARQIGEERERAIAMAKNTKEKLARARVATFNCRFCWTQVHLQVDVDSPGYIDGIYRSNYTIHNVRLRCPHGVCGSNNMQLA